VDQDEAGRRVLDAAAELFYQRGVQAVGMDEISTAAGVSLKRLYQCYAGKQQLVGAYLRRRDDSWRAALAEYVAGRSGTAEDKLLAVFDWLRIWCGEAGFRGCAFINAYGEFGAAAPEVATAAREHKCALQRYLARLAVEAGVSGPDGLAEALLLLVDGASTGAVLRSDPGPAEHARRAAATLIAAGSLTRAG
jgi:AcrR family transcriptional regulator